MNAPQRDDSDDYIKTNVFFDEQVRVLKLGEITNELGEMFMLLASRYVNHPNWNRYYHLRDDMIAAAVMACCRDCFKFRPIRNTIVRNASGEILSSTPVHWDGKDLEYHHTEHYSPLAYYTTVCRREFTDIVMKAYQQRNIVNQLLIDSGLEADEGYLSSMKAKEQREKEAQELEEEEKAIEDEKNSAKMAVRFD